MATEVNFIKVESMVKKLKEVITFGRIHSYTGVAMFPDFAKVHDVSPFSIGVEPFLNETYIRKNIMTEEEKYRLGRAAGEVFAEKLNKMFIEFKKDYEASDPNFDDQEYFDGFSDSVREDLDF